MHMKLRLNRHAKGFTLIEILVVIAIIAALSSIAWVAVGAVQSKQDENTANLHIEKIVASLNEYKANATTPLLWADGGEAGANALYQMLNCDFDGDGTTDKGYTPFCKELTYYEMGAGEKPEGLLYTEIPGKKKMYGILDPWNNFYYYRLGYAQSGPKTVAGKVKRGKHNDKVQKGKGLNVDFDVYSMGEDAMGDGRTNKDENEDNITNVKFLTN